MTLRRLLVLLIAILAAPHKLVLAQANPAPATTAVSLPIFEVAAIKPIDPNKGGMAGFYCYPGGRVILGSANIKMLLYYAYDMKDFQISGEPDWADAERYNIEATPPDSSHRAI